MHDVLEEGFCTRCGARKQDGLCPTGCERHASPAVAVAASTPRARTARLAPLWLIGLLGVALGVSALASMLLVREELARVRGMLDETRSLEQATEERLEDLASASDHLSARAGAVERQLGEQPDTAATAKRVGRSVFTIITDVGNGSGFVIASAGGTSKLLTNFHVVADTWLNGGRTVHVARGDLTYTGRIVDVSEANDLAVIKVNQRMAALEVAPARPAIGDTILVLGSPLGLGGTVTSGIVSAYRTEQGQTYLQFSAPISPGNSGGPVVDDRGRVVGIAVSKFVGGGAEGLGFAIPTRRMCAALVVC